MALAANAVRIPVAWNIWNMQQISRNMCRLAALLEDRPMRNIEKSCE